MKFAFMKEHCVEFCVEKMANILEVCRSGYYAFLKRQPSKRAIENQRLIDEVKEIHEKSRRTYGSPRIHAELKKKGESCSRKRVAKLMQRGQIQAKMRKKWVVTTCPGRKGSAIAPNYLDQNFMSAEPNQNWVSDITCVSTLEGWLYVAVVLDLFSRKVIGLSMGDSLATELVTKALKQALCRRGVKEGLLHHSDRGSQ